MEEPWDELMGPPDEGIPVNGSQRPVSRDPPAPVVRSVTPGSSPPPSMFRPSSANASGTNQRWSQYEAEADMDSTRAASSEAVYLASATALNRTDSQRSNSAFADDDMEIEAQNSRTFAPNGSQDVYLQQFGVPRSNNASYDEEDNNSVDSEIGREYDARNHDHIRQEALRMLEVADADEHYSVHRTITGGFTAQPKPLGNQRRTRTALQGLNFVANARAKTSRFGNYATTTASSPTRDDFEYGDVDSVVDVIGIENRSASAAAADGQSKSWSSRYSIDTTMLAMSGGAMKQKLDRMDRDHNMDRFSASNLFRNSPTKSPKIFGSGFDFRQQHVFGKQKVTIPTDNIQPVWNDDTDSPPLRARTWQEQLFYKKQQQRRWIICLVVALLCLIVPLISILSMRHSRSMNRSGNQSSSSTNADGFSFDDADSKPESDSAHQPVTFYVTTDSPHSPQDEIKLTNELASISKKASFAVHLGNIQDSNATNCSEETYADVATLLEESSPVRVFIVPGEEDWNNCPDPDAAWNSWYDNFYLFDAKWSRVREANNVTVDRQKNILENWAFVQQGVLFLGVHTVNGNVPSEGEFEARDRLNYEWVIGMNLEHQGEFRAMVVFGNAKPGQVQSKHFFHHFERYLSTYAFPTLYVHSSNGEEETGQYQPFTEMPHVFATRVKNDIKSEPLLLTVGFGDKPFTLA